MTAPGHHHTLEIRNLSVRAGGTEILSGINADVRCGEVTALVGPNGAGKSTLLLAILGLVPYTGEIRFCRAAEHGKGAPRIGYVPQRLDFDRNAPMTVLDFLSLSSQRYPVVFGHSTRSRRSAEECLARGNAAHLLLRPLGKLSGGELQRVLLALALRDNPDILLLDEPVSGVDLSGEELFCDFLSQIHSESRFSLLLVSHDLSVVSRHADRVICLNRRIVCQGATTETLTPENLAAMYGSGAHLFSHGAAEGHGHLHVPPPGHGERKGD
ncbi:MAG TPA: metal ABC transporter ATP-binding protein [Candidatus Deferrimicrobiaceae bacterium]|nr:metal ABC transporter ATP-binding protein [Candidatus Deferrimicrobiaceae bacterium]